MEPRTACECPMAQFCNRHGINKSAHLHKLCQTNEKYFEMWESCKGPGQHGIDCEKIPITEAIKDQPEIEAVKEEAVIQKPEEVKLPSILQQAKNFAGAAAQHVLGGMKNASNEEKNRRLDICKKCPHLIREEMRCGKCGCFLETKASWQTSSCPIGQW